MEAAVASVVLTAIAGIFGIAAFIRGEIARRAAVKVDEFTAVTGAQGAFIAILQATVAGLSAEVKECNADKAAMKVRFQQEIADLHHQIDELRRNR